MLPRLCHRGVEFSQYEPAAENPKEHPKLSPRAGRRRSLVLLLSASEESAAEQPPHSNRNMLVVNCVLLAEWHGRFATSPAAPVHRECGQLANASERARPVWFVRDWRARFPTDWLPDDFDDDADNVYEGELNDLDVWLQEHT